MGNFFFERECRTPYSESYTIVEDEDPIGSIDLHYTQNIVHATLCVSESLTRDSILEFHFLFHAILRSLFANKPPAKNPIIKEKNISKIRLTNNQDFILSHLMVRPNCILIG